MKQFAGRAIGLIALFLFPVWYLNMLAQHMTVQGAVLFAVYFTAAGFWWFNPNGTHVVIKTIIVFAQLVILAIFAVGYACNGC